MTANKRKEPSDRILERMLSILKIGLVVTIYFSLCVIIILVIIGAGP